MRDIFETTLCCRRRAISRRRAPSICLRLARIASADIAAAIRLIDETIVAESGPATPYGGFV